MKICIDKDIFYLITILKKKDYYEE